MQGILTLCAVCHLSRGFCNSFQALLQFCLVSSWSFAHLRTDILTPLGAVGRNSHKAFASHFCRGHGSPLCAWSKINPSPRSLAPWGRASSEEPFTQRSGIIAFSALAWARQIPHWDMFAKGLECCLIFSPRFPIVHLSVHWEEQIGGPMWMTSCGRWMGSR